MDIEIDKKIKMAEQYYNSKGTRKNIEKAISIYRELVDKYNNIVAKRHLAEIYLTKGYIEEDFEVNDAKGTELAFDYYSELAEKYNDKESKLFLATVYYDEDSYYSERYEPNYEKAFKLFNELVEDFDDEESKLFLAEMYYCGKGTEKNIEKSYCILEELVEKYNNLDAEKIIAGMYYYGEFLEKNYNRTLEILKSKDEHEIEMQLAQIYYHGLEIECLEKKFTLFCDNKKAFELFNDLIEKYNDIEAIRKIAYMYENGIFVKESREKALGIYRDLADKYNDIEAMREIADMYYYTFGSDKDEKKAFGLYKDLADKYNDEESKLQIAKMYEKGYGVSKDEEKSASIYLELSQKYKNEDAKHSLAVYYYYKGEYNKSLELLNELAFDYNNEDAKLILAFLLYKGRFEIYPDMPSFQNFNIYQTNYEKAFKLFNELVEDFDNADAKFYLAEMYYYGTYVKKDYERAFELFQEVAILNDYNLIEEDARCYVGKMFYNGEYVIEDYKKAFQIFNTLVEKHNHSDATFYLGEMYYYGFYVREDRKKAFELFSKIADYDKDAKEYINDMYEDKVHIKKNSIAFDFWEEVMKKTFEIYDQLKELGYEDRVEQQDMTMDIIQAIEDNQNIIYDNLRKEKGTAGLARVYAEVHSWLEEPYKLFRNYSIYYFMEVLK